MAVNRQAAERPELHPDVPVDIEDSGGHVHIQPKNGSQKGVIYLGHKTISDVGRTNGSAVPNGSMEHARPIQLTLYGDPCESGENDLRPPTLFQLLKRFRSPPNELLRESDAAILGAIVNPPRNDAKSIRRKLNRQEPTSMDPTGIELLSGINDRDGRKRIAITLIENCEIYNLDEFYHGAGADS